MREYIFTELERTLLEKFFSGNLPSTDMNLRKLIYRIRTFKELHSDVALYLKASKAVAAKK